jgi:protein-arginine kinase activator protein McsA
MPILELKNVLLVCDKCDKAELYQNYNEGFDTPFNWYHIEKSVKAYMYYNHEHGFDEYQKFTLKKLYCASCYYEFVSKKGTGAA